MRHYLQGDKSKKLFLNLLFIFAHYGVVKWELLTITLELSETRQTVNAYQERLTGMGSLELKAFKHSKNKFQCWYCLKVVKRHHSQSVPKTTPVLHCR